MRRHHTLLFLTIGVLAGAACNSPSTSAVLPTAPTSTVAAPAPPSGIAISGKVYDTGNRPLAGATVEVVNGASAGLKATTGPDGSYAM